MISVMNRVTSTVTRTAHPSSPRPWPWPRPWPGLWLVVLVLVGLLAVPDDGLAQERELERVETLIADGEYEQARAEIAAWWEKVDAGHPAPGPHRARALLLRARLEPDPKIAELDYLALVLTYPTAPEAPEALLRLGQGLLATGDSARAGAYLERLVNDHPSSPQRPVGALWLARARQADATQATQATGTQATGTQLGQPSGAEPSEQRPASPAGVAADADGRFAVQSGAFRQRQGALELAERLRRAGHEPRLVGLPGSSLVRVRVGRFADREDARALVQRLIADGFEALVVADAEREQPTR